MSHIKALCPMPIKFALTYFKAQSNHNFSVQMIFSWRTSNIKHTHIGSQTFCVCIMFLLFHHERWKLSFVIVLWKCKQCLRRVCAGAFLTSQCALPRCSQRSSLVPGHHHTGLRSGTQPANMTHILHLSPRVRSTKSHRRDDCSGSGFSQNCGWNTWLRSSNATDSVYCGGGESPNTRCVSVRLWGSLWSFMSDESFLLILVQFLQHQGLQSLSRVELSNAPVSNLFVGSVTLLSHLVWETAQWFWPCNIQEWDNLITWHQNYWFRVKSTIKQNKKR